MPTSFRLAEVLAAKGMSQYELERLSGVSRVTINQMCRNKTENVRLQTLVAIAEALQVELGDLVVHTRT